MVLSWFKETDWQTHFLSGLTSHHQYRFSTFLLAAFPLMPNRKIKELRWEAAPALDV